MKSFATMAWRQCARRAHADRLWQPAIALAMGLAALLLAPQLEAQERSRRIGILWPSTAEAAKPNMQVYIDALHEAGYMEGRNLLLDYRYAQSRFERLPALARELVELGPDVILAPTTPGSLAAKAATSSIPIVIANVADPVGAGLVKTLARPGGNVTGVTNLTAELSGKRVELLREVLPAARRIAVFINPDDPNARLQMGHAQAAARRFGIELQPLVKVRSAADLEPGFRQAIRQGAQAGIRMVDPLTTPLRKVTADLALQHRLPMIFAFAEDVEAGGLLAYGASVQEQYHRAAMLTIRILRGARPGPIEQPTRFETAVNTGSARTLNVTLPPALLLRATRVIE